MIAIWLTCWGAWLTLVERGENHLLHVGEGLNHQRVQDERINIKAMIESKQRADTKKIRSLETYCCICQFFTRESPDQQMIHFQRDMKACLSGKHLDQFGQSWQPGISYIKMGGKQKHSPLATGLCYEHPASNMSTSNKFLLYEPGGWQQTIQCFNSA